MIQADGMSLNASVSTHYHWDHIGGTRNSPDSSKNKHSGLGMMVIPGIKEWSSEHLRVYLPALEVSLSHTHTYSLSLSLRGTS